jgi:hypothetical protein
MPTGRLLEEAVVGNMKSKVRCMNMRVSLMVIMLLVIVTLFSSACSQNRTKEGAAQDSVVIDLKLAELVQTVLNLPAVVKYSKLDLIRREYQKVYVSFDSAALKPDTSIIYQKGLPLEVIKLKQDFEGPCYVFEKIVIHENTAYVSLYFKVTGFISSGKLTYANGKWIPDKNFTIGYR